MRKLPFFFFLLMYGLGLPAAFADSLGPLSVQNRFPLHLMFLKPEPVAAESLSRDELQASLSIDYSSVYFEQQNSQWDVLIDMEMTVLQVRLAYGLTARSGIRIDIPVARMDDGFLDGFLQDYHDALNVSNYGRENRPENEFAFTVSKDGTLWQGHSGRFALADITVSGQWELPLFSTWDSFSIAVVASIQLPTGDTSTGFGNGRFDYGVYTPMQWSGNTWTFYLMPGLALLADPDTKGADVSAGKNVSLFAGSAYHYRKDLDLNAQISYYTSPIEKTGINQLDDGAMELALGFKYRLSRHWVLGFAFCEDLMRAAPDFTINLNLTWQHVFTKKSNERKNLRDQKIGKSYEYPLYRKAKL